MEDRACGGVDSIPKDEYWDYVCACGYALNDDFEYGRKMKIDKAIEKGLLGRLPSETEE